MVKIYCRHVKINIILFPIEEIMGDANVCNQLKLGESVLDNSAKRSELAQSASSSITYQPLLSSQFLYLRLRSEKWGKTSCLMADFFRLRYDTFRDLTARHLFWDWQMLNVHRASSWASACWLLPRLFCLVDQCRKCDWESSSTLRRLSFHTHTPTGDLEGNTVTKRNKWLSDILPLVLRSILENGLSGNKRVDLSFV